MLCAAVSQPADNLVSKLSAKKDATVGGIIKEMGVVGLFTRGLVLRIIMVRGSESCLQPLPARSASKACVALFPTAMPMWLAAPSKHDEDARTLDGTQPLFSMRGLPSRLPRSAALLSYLLAAACPQILAAWHRVPPDPPACTCCAVLCCACAAGGHADRPAVGHLRRVQGLRWPSYKRRCVVEANMRRNG